MFQYPNSSEWISVKILGRAGKAKGKNSSWFNVDNGKRQWSVDWSKLKSWKVVVDPSLLVNEIVMDNNNDTDDGLFLEEGVLIQTLLASCEGNISNDLYKKEKAEELKKWKDFDAYEDVQHGDQNFITGRWICTEKTVDGVLVKKARYAVRGFQEKCDIQSDSPTGSKECMRLLLAVVACENWTLQSIDVKSAFLQGKYMDRIVYLKPPPEANADGKLWKLKKCLYGLNDAARMWYFALRDELESLNCIRSKIDYALFAWYFNDKLCGILEIHVDDIIWAGTKEFEDAVILSICSTFQIKSKSSNIFVHLGISICQENNCIVIDQIEYIMKVEPVLLTNKRKCAKKDFCTDVEAHKLRQLVGRLNWISTQTRPDIAFSVCAASTQLKKPTIQDVITANKILSNIKTNPMKIKFPAIGQI